MRRGLRAVADAGLVYDLLTLPHQLPAAIDTVRALPGLTFVLDHLSKPPIAAGGLDPWAMLVRELASSAETIRPRLSGGPTEFSQRIILQEYRVIITGGDAAAIGHRAG